MVETAEEVLAALALRLPSVAVEPGSDLVWVEVPDGRSIPVLKVRLACVQRWALLDPDDERRTPIVPDDPELPALVDEVVAVYSRLVKPAG